ncbi:MAG: aminopeptidase N [Rhizomicrobium sp.]
MRTDEPRAIQLADYKAPDFRIETVHLDFRLDPDATRVAAKLEVVRKIPDAALTLHGEGLKLLSLALNGRPLSAGQYRLDGETLAIPDVPDRFTLETACEIAPRANLALEGLYQSAGMFCTQCEPEGFRRITWFLDRPDNLSVFTVRIEASKQHYPVLLSNGNRLSAGELLGGRHFALWHDPFPKPSYLFALVAGDLGAIEDRFVTMSGREIGLAIYVEHGNEDKAGYAMGALKRAMKWDEENYGREYDLDIFMIVAVSAFNMGAMENKGLNIFNDRVLLASPETATDSDYARIEGVVAHEYFHNWTGDRITCRDWFQLSLKEGLTVFRDQSFSADMRGAAVQRIKDVRALRARQFQEDGGPLAHPVQPQSYIEINNFYTATVYEKGAEVIGMLKTLAGPEGYRKATDLYFARHDGQAVTVEEWVKCFEDGCGRDFGQFRLWYRQAGTPVVEANGHYDRAGRRYVLELSQTVPPTPGQPDKKPMHIPVRMGLIGQSGAALALALEGENAAGPASRVLELCQHRQRFVFVDIAEAPLLSLGQGFSAPVIFKTPLASGERAVLMSADGDAFNRWQAGQALAAEIMLAGGDAGRDYLAGLEAVLEKASGDPAFAAEMLTLPGESEIAALRSPADPDAIHDARLKLMGRVAMAHRAPLKRLYDELGDGAGFQPDARAAGRRSLRNACLGYLTAEGGEAAEALAYDHYLAAHNMTDMIAGLSALARMKGHLGEKGFVHFRDRFHAYPLVMDKWMSLKASSPRPDTAATVRELMKDRTFDLKNPNRVRALIGAFSTNHLRFHDKSGSGYRLVGEVIRALDSINPLVAARLAGAFESWRRYDRARQASMRAELEAILEQKGLSSNLFEVAGKMLA